MYSDQRMGTVRRNARVGLSVPMGASAQQGLMAGRMVAPNVAGMNARRSINAAPQMIGPPGLGGVGRGPVRPLPLPLPIRGPAMGPGGPVGPQIQPVTPFDRGGAPGAPPVRGTDMFPAGGPGPQVNPLQAMLASIGQALMAGQKGR